MDRSCSVYSAFYHCLYIISATVLIISCKPDHPDTPDYPHDIYKEVKHIGTAELSVARQGLTAATVGNKILFAGGFITKFDVDALPPTLLYYHSKRVDIYDALSNIWSIDSLSLPRSEIAAVSVNNKVFFAGGWFAYNDASGHSNTKLIDIYNAATNTWQTDTLSERKYYVAGGAIGNKAIFAGGLPGYTYQATNSIDIYDAPSNTWNRSLLSAPVAGKTAVSGNELFMFKPGSLVSKEVDVYNVSTNSLRTIQLSLERSDIAVAAAGGLVLFAGGIITGYSTVKLVDIYDTKTNTWSRDSLSLGRSGMAAVAAGNKILFAGGVVNGNYNSNVVDIYDVVTHTWSRDSLSYPSNRPAGATVGNKILFASGSQFNTRVDIFELSK